MLMGYNLGDNTAFFIYDYHGRLLLRQKTPVQIRLGLPKHFLDVTRLFRTGYVFLFVSFVSPFLPCFSRIYQGVGYNLGYKIIRPPRVSLGVFLFLAVG